MPVNFIDRFKIVPEDWETAQVYAIKEAKRLGLHCDRKIGVIMIHSSTDFWLLDAEGLPDLNQGPNPDLVDLAFHLGDEWRPEPYLRKIEFDIGSGEHSEKSGWAPSPNWQPSETSGDPPETLEELIERHGNTPHVLARLKEFPEFSELYRGIYGRLFPQVEHEDVHTALGAYEEGKTSPSHLKKEIWRTDLLTALQSLRFPPTEVEDTGSPPGVRVIWEPKGHTNYTIWFNLPIGGDPKVCAYVDPTLSGSTTGWLSTRLIKNENALAKLPYTIEQWAVEDLRKLSKDTAFAPACKGIRELLRHHVPRDMEEAWGAIRRQALVGVEHYDVHTSAGNYEESLTRKEADFKLIKDSAEIERLQPGERVYLIINSGKENEEFVNAKVVSVFTGEGMVKIYVDEPDIGWSEEEKTRVYSANTYLYREDLPTEHEDVHTAMGAYEESKRLTESEAFDFNPQNFQKVVDWAATTGGAVRAEIDEYTYSKDYQIRLDSGAKITIPGKGGRKYIFQFILKVGIEVPEAIAGPGSGYEFRIRHGAEIRYNTNYVGTGTGRYQNKILYDTLKEVREALVDYAPGGAVNYKSALWKYSYRAFKAVQDTSKFYFQKLDALYQEAVGLLTTVSREDVHTDTGYEESKRLKEGVEEEETRYYGIATGDGNHGVSTMSPEYIVLTNKPWDLAELAAYAQFKDEPGVREWVGKNMEIDGDSEYGIGVVFPESFEAQREREEELERQRAAAEEGGEEFDEQDFYDDLGDSETWFIIEIFPIPADEIDDYRCEVYTEEDHPPFLVPLEPFVPPPIPHEDVHTAAGEYEESTDVEAFLEVGRILLKG